MLRTLELQFALTMAGTAAFIALWLTLRRAAALAWLMFWICRGLGIGLSTVVFSEAENLPWLTTADALVLGASQVLLLHAVWQHALPNASWLQWLRWRRVVWVLLGVYLAAPWMAPHSALDPAATGGPLAILFRVAALPANALACAILISRRQTMDRLGGRLMIAGIVVQIIQNAGGALVTAIQLAAGWAVATPEAFVWLQILTYVSLALGSLYLVLAESRDEIHRIAAEREQGRHLETLGRMASGVAHDFNNVLSAIRLSSDLAKLKLAPGQSAEELETIRVAVEQGGEQVKSLLLFARGESPTARQRFDLHEAVRELEPMLRQLAGDRHRVQLALATGPAEIQADRSEVSRILSNLVVNARDAMADGGTITLATTFAPPTDESPAEGSTRAIVLRVSDTGVGISPDVLPRIFEPFYSTKGDRGTGLGLTIAQTFIQKMGGKISVSSELGRGTTFEIRLPLAGSS